MKSGSRKQHFLAMALASAAAIAGTSAGAEMRPTLSFSGATGLIDMPSGDMQPDGTLGFSSAHFGPVSRNTLSFQITPRISGSFRYTTTRNWDDVIAAPWPTYFDRSFDLRYQLATEGRYRPSVVIGLNDIVGTGQWSSEYIAATKTFGGKVKVTAGLGWGRLGSYGAIGAPFGTRPDVDFGAGGNVRLGQWFKGDVAPFAGVEWQVSNRLGLKAEYSSDAYAREAALRGTFDRKSPFNFGVEYQVSKGLRVGAHYMYGSEFGVTAQFLLNPKDSPTGGQLGNAPPLVQERSARGAQLAGWTSDWVTDDASRHAVQANVAKMLATQGITLETLSLSTSAAEVRIRVPKGENSAQVIGRTARILTGTLPASIERFDIVPVANSLPLSKISLNRRDIETLDNASGQDALIRQRTEIQSVSGISADALRSPGLYPKLTWNIGPYVRSSLFDPDSPIRADLGVRLSGKYEIAPGLLLSGSVSKRILGNLDASDRRETSALPQVRSNSNLYDKYGDPTLDHLTLAWYSKPGKDIYTRVTVGYLERMFGGVSGEVLWKPVDSRLAVGAELNYVKQREFNQLLAFQDYDVVTGHLSGYYSFDNGFTAQLDVGRYLAGDVGATLSIDREFANGWRVGAFATMTDVSFDDFGEGSFDKGIRLQIPFAWMTGRPSDKNYNTTLRPILRDGGARLDVDGRLYDTVRNYDAIRLDDQWGRFWR